MYADGMSVWVLADLHLAFSVPDKTMEVFGPAWKDYTKKIESHWRECVKADDLILIPGDISWAMRFEEALTDLNWIDALPGTKLILKGNHDYWWPSVSKLKEGLPPSIHFIQNNAFLWHEIAFAGVRLWDSVEYNFSNYIEMRENPLAKETVYVSNDEKNKHDERLFERDLGRLNLSLQQMDPSAKKRVVLTHYPPIGADLHPSRASEIFEKYRVDVAVFGHLHNVRPGSLPFGERNGVRYILTSADYLGFKPIQIF